MTGTILDLPNTKEDYDEYERLKMSSGNL